jgi:hypothetical protein
MRYLTEHTRWKDGTVTTAPVPDKGQGAADNVSDSIVAVWYTAYVCPPSAPFCGCCNSPIEGGYCYECGGRL